MADIKRSNPSNSALIKRRLADAGYSVRTWAARRAYTEASVRSWLQRGKWPPTVLEHLAEDLGLKEPKNLEAVLGELKVETTRAISTAGKTQHGAALLEGWNGRIQVDAVLDQIEHARVDDDRFPLTDKTSGDENTHFALCVQSFDGFVASADVALAARIMRVLRDAPTFEIFFFVGRLPNPDDLNLGQVADRLYQNLKEAAEDRDSNTCETLFDRVWIKPCEVANSFSEFVSRAMAVIAFSSPTATERTPSMIQLHVGVDADANNKSLENVRFTRVNLQKAPLSVRGYVRREIAGAEPIKEFRNKHSRSDE